MAITLFPNRVISPFSQIFFLALLPPIVFPMALFSSRFLLITRALLYTYTSYMLVFAPKTVIEYSGLLLLAQSMDLPLLMVNEKSPIYGAIGVVLFALVLSDVGPLIEANHAYFEITVLLRLVFSFAMCIFCYMVDSKAYVMVSNSVVFSFVFMEVWFGILTYSTLKEEKLNRARSTVKKSQELKLKYERDQLTTEEKAEFEKQLEEDEYRKLMSEFK